MSPQLEGKGGRRRLKIGSLSSPVVNSYRIRFPIVTTVFAAPTDRRTDRLNWSIAKGGTVHYSASATKNDVLC